MGGITEFRLECNGLKVLLSENHDKPVITYMTVYRVGSRNESRGRTGATHFLEHMMFKGTKERNPQTENGIFDVFRPLGNKLNATTAFDRTSYFECVGSEHIETCISMEADRMRNLRLSKEDFMGERKVVLNELERYENMPDMVMFNAIYAAAYQGHSYRDPIIGWRSELEAVDVDVLRTFYDEFYWPNNCTVLLRGDFETIEALALIAKHYGHISSSPKPIPLVPTAEPAQRGERRFKIRRSGDLSRVWLAYHVPEAAHDDTYPIACLAAILGGSEQKSSRLYKRLVETGMCAGVQVQHVKQRDPGLLFIAATVNNGIERAAVEEAIVDELAKLGREPVSVEELNRALVCDRKGTILGALDPMGWALLVCEAEASYDWTWGIKYNDELDKVTAGDIARVVGLYFDEDNRTVGHFIPRTETEEDEEPAKQTAVKKPTFASQVVKRVLANGLTIFVQPTSGSGAVALSGKIRAGDSFCEANQLVPELAAFMLAHGSHGLDKLAAAQRLEEMGPSASALAFTTDRFAVSFGATVVKDDFANFADIVATMLRHPLFDKGELDLALARFHSFIASAADDTGKVANNTLSGKLYQDGPHAQASFAQAAELLGLITPEMLHAFHSACFSPKSTILSVVGDTDAEQVFALFEKLFGDWVGPEAKDISFALSTHKGRERIDVHRADKSSADIVIGLPCAVKRSAADFLAARIANTALGGDTIGSRLGKVVRGKGNLTYGIASKFDDIQFGDAPWLIQLTCAPQNVDLALRLVEETVSEFVADGICDEELSLNARSAAASFQVALRTDQEVAATLTALAFMGLGVEDMDTYPEQLKAVTKEEVNAAIRKYFRLEDAVTVVCGTL
jgi:zinc protease